MEASLRKFGLFHCIKCSLFLILANISGSEERTNSGELEMFNSIDTKRQVELKL